jgi:hypothetical protein
MELHLPYLILRGPSKKSIHPNSRDNVPTKMPLYDLSFMMPALNENGWVCQPLIYDAHVTIVVAGCDEWNHNSYSFLDPGSMKNHFEEDDVDDGDEDENNPEDSEDQEDEPSEDHFATEGWDYVNANEPIWDPRVYFLRAVQIRIVLASQEYDYLIEYLEEKVEAWVRSSNKAW